MWIIVLSVLVLVVMLGAHWEHGNFDIGFWFLAALAVLFLVILVSN